MTVARPPEEPAGAGPAPPARLHDAAVLLDSDRAHAMVRLLEAAPAVQRRFQFFIWTQSQLQPLVPHALMVCGVYQRQRRQVVFDAFHSVVVSANTLAQLTSAEGPLTQWLTQAWIAGRGQPVAVPLQQASAEALPAARRLGDELGLRELLVHGVARPQRPSEIESLFILGGPSAAEGSMARLVWLDLVLPHLHRVWQRVVSTEHEMLRPCDAPAQRTPPPAGAAGKGQTITPRERQILRWVRDGRSNQQVAGELGISPLTVKNHVQKILRKLGASNRAQAVALAMSQDLLGGDEPPSDGR
jgi:transcriptional regulator EpsA